MDTLDVVPAPKRRATYEDLMQVPDTKIAELIDGELIVSPRARGPARACRHRHRRRCRRGAA